MIVVIAAAGLIAGHAGKGRMASDPVATVDGVPVGIEHTPAGALAAADNYLAFEQRTVERDPAGFARLVAVAYTPGIRSASLQAAESGRLSDPRGLALWARGGQSFTVIGAHRLDSYGSDSATVTTWAGQLYWGPGQSPEQVWALGRMTLRWADGRWLVSAMRTLPSPAPVPAATPQAGPGDDSSRTLDGQLQGFTPVSYGAAGG